MPRDYQRTPSSRATGSGAVSAARAGSLAGDLNDALLKGSAETRNPDPFTPEVRAAYAAFSGITDEIIARRLWRKFVTWDDVSDYVDAGVGIIDYDTMITLKTSRITPQLWQEWRAVMSDLYPAAVIERLKRLVPLGADSQTYAMWNDEQRDRSPSTTSPWRLDFGSNYHSLLSTFRNKCHTRGVDYEPTVIVAEALALTSARNTGSKKNTSDGWIDLLAEGMDPVRAAALIYAGVTKPSQAPTWDDRSVQTILAFALLQGTVPQKVMLLGGMGSGSPLDTAAVPA